MGEVGGVSGHLVSGWAQLGVQQTLLRPVPSFTCLALVEPCTLCEMLVMGARRESACREVHAWAHACFCTCNEAAMSSAMRPCGHAAVRRAPQVGLPVLRRPPGAARGRHCAGPLQVVGIAPMGEMGRKGGTVELSGGACSGVSERAGAAPAPAPHGQANRGERQNFLRGF